MRRVFSKEIAHITLQRISSKFKMKLLKRKISNQSSKFYLQDRIVVLALSMSVEMLQE